MARLVIVGVDGSAHSLAALRWAAGSASTKRAVLRAVTVWTPLPWHGVPDSLRRALEVAQPRSASAARFTLDGAVSGCDFGGRPVEPYIVAGTPGPALVEASSDADLLVVGVGGDTSGPSLSGRAVGPTAWYVARHVPCPTVVISHGHAVDDAAEGPLDHARGRSPSAAGRC